jgi:hypothetical protein
MVEILGMTAIVSPTSVSNEMSLPSMLWVRMMADAIGELS